MENKIMQTEVNNQQISEEVNNQQPEDKNVENKNSNEVVRMVISHTVRSEVYMSIPCDIAKDLLNNNNVNNFKEYAHCELRQMGLEDPKILKIFDLGNIPVNIDVDNK